MAFEEKRAGEIINKSRDLYKCNQVVNFVLNGDKDKGSNAKGYLDYGIPFFIPRKGVVVVSAKGDHVGIFVSDTHFIHSSSKLGKVWKVPVSGLPDVFPAGYHFRMGGPDLLNLIKNLFD